MSVFGGYVGVEDVESTTRAAIKTTREANPLR